MKTKGDCKCFSIICRFTFMQKSKVNLIIDMQYGSTGKGLFASYLATTHHVDIAISNLSPNAGHTFEYQGGFAVSKQIPVCCILNKRCGAYLTAGSIIDIDLLFCEMEKFNISEDCIVIHPNAAIITKEDVENELCNDSSVKKIASTMSGTGFALANKIKRSSKVAKDYSELKNMVKILDLHSYMDQNCTVLMESSQGFDLSLSAGISYPFCTSRDITVSSLLNDAQIHPSYLGTVYGCMRTYPIRVGNIVENGSEVGNSGNFYPDSKELTWKELDLPDEYTTNTKRIRRVATFSKQQYIRSLDILRPDVVFLNFVNYLTVDHWDEIENIFTEVQYPNLYGHGPKIKDIKRTMEF